MRCIRIQFKLVIAFAVAFASIASHALEFSRKFDGHPTILAKGEIRSEDTERFAEYLRTQKHLPATLELDSGGGAVGEAFRLASVLQRLYLSTAVRPSGRCASACFIVWLAGSGRHAAGADVLRNASESERTKLPGPLGLHRPYLREPTGTEDQLNVMREVRDRLAHDLIPGRLIDLMMSRASNDVYWLSFDDLEQLGIYPPQQEELFIKQCGYDRNYVKLFASKRRDEANRMEEAFERTQRCISDIQDELRKEAVSKVRRGNLR
jgi:hypothetical protein